MYASHFVRSQWRWVLVVSALASLAACSDSPSAHPAPSATAVSESTDQGFGAASGSSPAADTKPPVIRTFPATHAPRVTTNVPVPHSTTTKPATDLSDGQHYAIIKALTASPRRVTFDKVELLTGKAAQDACKAAGIECFNDYYIQNQTHKLRTLPISSGATFQRFNRSGTPGLVTATLSQVATDASSGIAQYYTLTVSGGVVTKIAEFYTP